MRVGDKVVVTYPNSTIREGTISCIVPRKDRPPLLTVRGESGRLFICDENMVKPVEDNNG